jgi:glutathione S-transferase
MSGMRLLCANLNYSSWSVRAWLALMRSGLAFEVEDVGLKTRAGWKERILEVSGAGRVPVLIDHDLKIHESLAICEYVAEMRPEARLWPEDRRFRARARAASCEMLGDFSALRRRMPMNLRARARATPAGPDVDAEAKRVFELWGECLSASGGPFLFGGFGIADCMYFPVATRFRTYGVKLGAVAQRYSDALFALPEAEELERLALHTPPIDEYDAALGAG